MAEAARNYSIIGVHGLRRKPPKDILRRDWLRALQEGLRNNYQLQIQPEDLAFELIYWADWLGSEPYAAGEDKQPYTEAEGEGPLPRSSSVDRINKFSRNPCRTSSSLCADLGFRYTHHLWHDVEYRGVDQPLLDDPPAVHGSAAILRHRAIGVVALELA